MIPAFHAQVPDLKRCVIKEKFNSKHSPFHTDGLSHTYWYNKYELFILYIRLSKFPYLKIFIVANSVEPDEMSMLGGISSGS